MATKLRNLWHVHQATILCACASRYLTPYKSSQCVFGSRTLESREDTLGVQFSGHWSGQRGAGRENLNMLQAEGHRQMQMCVATMNRTDCLKMNGDDGMTLCPLYILGLHSTSVSL